MKPQSQLRRLGDGVLSFTRTELFIKLILLFPLATLFQYHLSFLNKGLFFLCLVVLLFVNQVKRKPILYLGFVSLTWLFSMAVTPMEALRLNLNMAFYYVFLVFYLVFFLTQKQRIWEILLRSRRYIFWTVVIYTAVLSLSILLPSSYTQMTAGGWGEERYFVSISGSPNRVGPASVFVTVLLTFLVATGSPKWIAVLVLPQLYAFLMGGSRTYFVVGCCAALVLYYVLFRRKRWFYATLIPLGILALMVVLRSSIMDKIAATTATEGVSQQELLRRLTNSRSVFWVEQLKLFRQTSALKQFLGNGINFTTHRYGLWAHSDFIEILCSYGYLGLFNYLALMLYTLRKLLKTRRSHFLIKCVVIFIWFFNAFFNFFYCYFCAVLCYPILLLTIHHLDEAPVSRKEVAS